MKLGTNLSRNTKRSKKSIEFWLRVSTDCNAGLTAEQISKRYKNPKTKKHYTVKHIYWVIRELKTRPIN